MKKAAVCVRDKKKLPNIKKILKSRGMSFVRIKPDFVVCLGGDGTFLFAERKYPGVPKLLIKDSKVCKKCVGSNQETILDFLKLNAYEISEEMKLEGNFRGNKLLAANDILIRNKRPNQAIRLEISIDNEKKHDEMIGDGLIISTPFGSSAYYKSVTRDEFKEGIGLAFSNSVEEHEPVILNENQVLKVKLVRGDAQIAYDNSPDIYTLKEGETITIKSAKQKAKLIKMEGFGL
ncbi:hypothetical protein ACFLTH_05500 [Bacteroidota bacterium]